MEKPNKPKGQPGQPAKSQPGKPAPATPPPVAPPIKVAPLFRKMDWLVLIVCFAAIWIAYLWTLAPDLTLEDSGELCTASFYAGIPHPPGYPFWSVYSYFWTLFPFGSVTWRVELGESFAAAMACGLVGLMVSRGSSMLIEGIQDLNNAISRNWENAICIVCGITAGLLLGFDDFMWKESVVINRISVFDVPWLMLVAAMLMRWIYAPQQRRYLYAAMFFFGLTFTIHQTMLLAAMGIETVVVMANPKLGRDLLLGNSVIYIAVLMASSAGMLPAYDNLDYVFKAIFHVVGISSIALCFWLTTKTKSLGTETKILIVLGLCWLVGAAFFFYEPISCMTDPPMQWGYPRTVEGFFHAFTRGQYESSHPTDIFHEKARFIMQLGLLVNGLANSFSWVFLIVALLPFLFLWKMQRRERNWIIGLAAIYFCVGILLTIIMNTTPDRQAAEEAKVFFTASHGIVAIMIGYGLALLSAFMATHYKNFRPMALTLGVVTLLPALTLLWDSVSMTFYGGTGLLDYKEIFLLFLSMVAAFTLTALATNYFLKSRGDKAVPNDRFYSSIFGVAAALFLILSIYLAFFIRKGFGLAQILQAMPKLFAPHQYSSPAIGALILVGAVVIFIGSVFIYRSRAPLAITLALFMLTPVYSGLTHWANGEERNHWFGYWFGHDMFTPPFVAPNGKFSYDPKLRAEAAKGKDGNLVYPEMARNAIVFGGTDPGRFCPTYMIFCESFVPPRCKPMDPNFDRRDCYLITQNALADDTYLDYLRAQYFRSAQIDPPFFREFLKLYGVPIVAALLALCVIWIVMDFIQINPRRNRNAIVIGSVWGIIFIIIFWNAHGDGFARGISDAGYNILDKPLTKFGANVEAKRRAEGVYPPKEIYIPSSEDLSRSFSDYQQDFETRYQEGRLLPGESAQTDAAGHLMIGGTVSVMMVNGLLCKDIFDRNPTNEFYVEESFPLEWMYPYETPYGIIMKINRQPVQSLSDATLHRDHEFWSKYCERFIGTNVVTDTTSVAEICTNFIQKVYLDHNYNGFKGDLKFIRDEDAQKAFSKLRDSQAGMYAWRLRLLVPNVPLSDPNFINYRPKTDVDIQQLMAKYGTNFGQAVADGAAGHEVQELYKECDYAFKQSFAFCPYSPEAIVRYVNFLYQFQRFDDALLVAETCKKLDPYNTQMDDIIDQIKGIQAQMNERTKAIGSLQQMEMEAHEHPSNVNNLISLGTAYYQLGQSDRAEQVFDSALTNSALTYEQIANIVQFYSILGPSHYDKLETALKKMTDLASNVPEAHYDLAAMEAMHGEITNALDQLRLTMQLNAARLKTNPAAKNLLLTNLNDHRFDSLRNLPEYQKIISQ